MISHVEAGCNRLQWKGALRWQCPLEMVLSCHLRVTALMTACLRGKGIMVNNFILSVSMLGNEEVQYFHCFPHYWKIKFKLFIFFNQLPRSAKLSDVLLLAHNLLTWLVTCLVSLCAFLLHGCLSQETPPSWPSYQNSYHPLKLCFKRIFSSVYCSPQLSVLSPFS